MNNFQAFAGGAIGALIIFAVIYFTVKLYTQYMDRGLGPIDAMLAMVILIIVIIFGSISLLYAVDVGAKKIENYRPQSESVRFVFENKDDVVAYISGATKGTSYYDEGGYDPAQAPAQAPVPAPQPQAPQAQAPVPAPQPQAPQAQAPRVIMRDDALITWLGLRQADGLANWDKTTARKNGQKWIPRGVLIQILDCRNCRWRTAKNEIWDAVASWTNPDSAQIELPFVLNGYVARNLGAGDHGRVVTVAGTGTWPAGTFDTIYPEPVQPAAPAEAPAPAEVPAAPAEVLWVGTVSTPDGALNCRKKAIVQDNIVTVLKNGEEVQVLSDDTLGWGEVQTATGQKCFVALRFLEKTVKQ